MLFAGTEVRIGSFATEAACSAVRLTTAWPPKLTSDSYRVFGRDGLNAAEPAKAAGRACPLLIRQTADFRSAEYDVKGWGTRAVHQNQRFGKPVSKSSAAILQGCPAPQVTRECCDRDVNMADVVMDVFLR